MITNPDQKDVHRDARVNARRRSILLTLLSMGVAGCSNSPVVQSTVEAFRIAYDGHPDTPLTRSEVAALPYATIGAKLGKGPRGMMVLGRIEDDELHWFSADRIVLVTRYGRLVASAGLPSNLKRSHSVGNDPLQTGLHHLSGPISAKRLIDVMPGNHFSVPVTSRFETLGAERIEILDLEFDTVLVRETGSAPLLDWEFENFYWADQATGQIWKSLQHIVPELPPFRIETFKPAS